MAVDDIGELAVGAVGDADRVIASAHDVAHRAVIRVEFGHTGERRFG